MEPERAKAPFSAVGLDYWLLSATAGFLWSCPIVAISNTDFGREDLLLGSVVGVLMGALILPWIRRHKISDNAVLILGVVTLILAAPGFLILKDLLRAVPSFPHDLGSLLKTWMGMAFSMVLTYGLILVPLATLTVYGLWRWLDFRNRRC